MIFVLQLFLFTPLVLKTTSKTLWLQSQPQKTTIPTGKL